MRIRLVCLCGIGLVLSTVHFHPPLSAAPCTPWAEAVDAANTASVTDPENSLGPPDGNTAVVASQQGASLALDLGEGQASDRHLIIHFAGVAVEVAAPVEFYDAESNLVGNAEAVLASSAGSAAAVALYTNTVPYRFVTLRGNPLGSYGVDAINAICLPTPEDPYAVDATSFGISLPLNPGNAVGPPDGTYATMVVAALSGGLELDLGQGSEGTWHLIVHYGPLAVQLATTVEFLDSSQDVVYSQPLLLGASVDDTQAAVLYDNDPAIPYRYVRISSLASSFLIDAVETISTGGHLASAMSADSATANMAVTWNNTLPGYLYSLQAADELLGPQSWITIATNVLAGDRALTIDDIDISQLPYRLFRLQEEGPSP